MDQQPLDLWIAAIVLILWPASIVTWIALLARRAQRGEFLAYEPRRPVPWNAPVALLTVLFVVVALLSGTTRETEAPPSSNRPSAETEFEPTAPPVNKLDAQDSIPRLSGFIVFQTLVVGGVLAAIAITYNTKWHDFGLPASAAEFRRDVGLGIVAFLAALAPVQGLQALMLWLFGMTEDAPAHPLIEMVTAGGPNIPLLLLASAAAIVVAPFTEEVLFRLLLQGWLEKREDQRTGRFLATDSDPIPGADVGEPYSSEPMADTAAGMATHESLQPPAQAFAVESQPDSHIMPPATESDATPTATASVLPHGWLPILCSAALFAIAHFGYGPDPIPLFFLALILGYVYQRTHRILPCIVAHALFNSVAIFVLWRMVFSHDV